jgi:hypothetical protein
MLYSEIIAVCSQILTKHINTLCGQNVEFVNVKPASTQKNHLLKSSKKVLKLSPFDCQTSITSKELILNCTTFF